MAEFLAFIRALWSVIKVIGWPVAVLLVAYFCIRYSDKILIWISLLERYVGLISSKRKRKNISNEIEGRINSFAKKINSDVDNIFPYGIKLQWVEDLGDDFDREAFVRKNQVVIKMKSHQNQDRNLSIATLEYISKGLIPKGRVYVSKNIMKSVDFKMVHKILMNNKLYSALEYFNDHILSLEIRDEPKIEEYFEKMNNLDDHGLFTSVFLFELMMLGKKIPPGFENIRKRAISEVKEFVLFLNDLAIRKPGEEGRLDFIRKEIRVSLLLIARPEHLGHEERYLKRFEKNLKKGCERVYIGSIGLTNNSFAEGVCSSIKEEYEVEKLLERTVDVMNRTGNVTKGYVCVFQPKS